MIEWNNWFWVAKHTWTVVLWHLARAEQVLRKGNRQRQGTTPLLATEHKGMRHTLCLCIRDEFVLDGFLAYDVSELHVWTM